MAAFLRVFAKKVTVLRSPFELLVRINFTRFLFRIPRLSSNALIVSVPAKAPEGHPLETIYSVYILTRKRRVKKESLYTRILHFLQATVKK